MVDQRKMLLDFATGKAAIYTVDSLNPADEAPFNDPLGNIDRVAFHSDLDYMEVVHTQTVSFEFPAIADDTYAIFSYSPFAAHSLGYIPLVAFRVDGVLIPPGQKIQVIGSRYRALFLEVTTTTSILWVYTKTADLGLVALTVEMELVLMGVVVPDVGTPKIDINPSAGYVQLGQQRLDTRRRLLRVGTPAIMSIHGGLSHDASIDGADVGLRTWLTDGTTEDVQTYTDAYAGPDLYDLKR